jgi:hypothetical protein
MRHHDWFGVVRTVTVAFVVVLFAAVSSGAVPFSAPSAPLSADIAVARDLAGNRIRQLPPDNDLPEPDNTSLCSPRVGPRVQASADPSGRLRITITAATAFDGFPIAIRRLRIGPSQNAAVDIGPFVARTDPFYINLIGVESVTFAASRIAAGQPLHIPLLVFDDCGDWPTFVGAGTGVSLPAAAPTATLIPCPGTSPCGSIPIDLFIDDPFGFAPGARVTAFIESRPHATCELRVQYPGQSSISLGTQTANSVGDCRYDFIVPFSVAFGQGTVTGTARDAFGFNLEVFRFSIQGEDEDNIEE